jgi:ribonucleotide reductase alpha subunit
MGEAIFNQNEVLDACIGYFNGDIMQASVAQKKYLLRDKNEAYHELTPHDMHDRLAKEFTRVEKKMNKSINETEYFTKIRALLNRFSKTVPQGSPMAAIGNKFQMQSLSNCMVIASPNDSISGIFKSGLEIAELAKRRCGIGLDISTLRPFGSTVNNAALSSSGVPCFSDLYSHITRMIGQKGRIGALMLTLDIKHPDAELFIKMKSDLTKVTGANVSLKLSDEFMKAVESNNEFVQQWPINVPLNKAKVIKRIKAAELWNLIVEQAWKTAEPGLLMWDNYTRMLPAHNYPGFETQSTNPCLTGDTQLLTIDGYKTLKQIWEETGRLNIHDSDIVRSHLTIINRFGIADASTVYKTSDNSEIYKVTLENGYSIRATANHEFIVFDSMNVSCRKKLSDLSIGNKIGCVGYNGMSYSNIKFIDNVGPEPTYCLTERKNNEIIANGMIIGQCSELGLSANDSCRLISQNLFGWVKNPFTKDAYFDFDEYLTDTKLAQRMSDGLVELELEAIEKIISIADTDSERDLWKKIYKSAYDGRRTGLGTHGLADVFLALGLKYDSDDAIKLADKIYNTHKIASYSESVQMAKERGTFPVWDWKYDEMSEFIRNLPDDLKKDIKKYGRRNIANLTIAPTGSVSIMSGVSSGIEPVFRFVYDRRVKITNMDTLPVDHVDLIGDKWTHFRVVHPAVKNYFKLNNIKCPVNDGRDFSMSLDSANDAIKKLLPKYFITSDEIDYLQGVKLQAVATSHLDHGVSRTVNLPRGTNIDEVSEVYFKAWKLGLKGVTVYVEGSRDGVLLSETKKSNEEDRPETITESHAPKRPKTLEAEVHHIKIKNKDWAVVVGLLDKKPYEVFAGRGLVLPKTDKIESASISKITNNRYKLSIQIVNNGVEEYDDLREIYDNDEERVITRSVCRELRHGVPIEFIAKDLAEHAGSIANFSAALARVLKKYAKNANRLVKKCQQCSSNNFIMHDGCISCSDCGFSKCG